MDVDKEIKKQFNMLAARQQEQREIMQRAIDNGICCFCDEHLEKYHPKPILFKTKFWTVSENAWPYPKTKKHFVLFYRPEHIETSYDLSPEAWADIKVVMDKLRDEYSTEYGTLFMRFGNLESTGSSVRHLHMQVLQGDPDHEDYDPKIGVWTRVG